MTIRLLFVLLATFALAACGGGGGGGTSVTDNPPVADTDNPPVADTDNPPVADTDNPPVADTDNPPVANQCGQWCTNQMSYNTSSTTVIEMGQGYDASVREWQPMGRRPEQSYGYGGEIDGEIHPEHSQYLSDPRIRLMYSNNTAMISADITFDNSRTGMDDQVFRNFNVSLDSDGMFSSFNDDEPVGINGIIYGEYNRREQWIAGHVVTTRIYGTYIAGR